MPASKQNNNNNNDTTCTQQNYRMAPHERPSSSGLYAQNWTTQYWLSQGAPREKLILGLATYGMTYTLVNPAINGLMAPAYGGGRGAQYTQEYGIMAFYEVSVA